ncbi:hypothetical protein FIfi106_00111 [Erwinia phage FIfi106]|nr:hypothetical protein FIfi106_00111 [Erwinia phage FIfi106]
MYKNATPEQYAELTECLQEFKGLPYNAETLGRIREKVALQFPEEIVRTFHLNMLINGRPVTKL